MDRIEERIIELETKISYQEDLIQELNQHVITQQKQIDELTELNNLLKEQFKEIISIIPSASSGHEVPPHY
ncbi:MAG: SlyX family protein [Pseudomonadota bacterium]